jgi:predicted RND superfamily exporter protein
MMSTCTSAVLLTLLVQSMFGAKIGILTANLAIIVFVIALSHLVYMTFNWQTLTGRNKGHTQDLGEEARRMTFPASFWSMVCSSLGFGSLLIVPAKPLRELGVGGVLGTALAFVCAYLMYPAFLSWTDPRKTKVVAQGSDSAFWEKRFAWTSAVVVLASFALSFGLPRLNTDPSLLDYFKKHKPLRDELEYVDRNGGVNPLTLVVTAKSSAKLDTRDGYERMWALQNALEDYKGVGTVVSLPVLLAEGKRHPLAFFLSWEHLLRILEEPEHGRVAGTFVTEDRRAAAFYLRMVERGRQKTRIQVVNDLRVIVRRHGFRPFLVGGVYQLQGELAQLVESSLIKGLGWLIVFFAGIAWIVARSIRGATAMIFGLCLVPLCTLGGVGLLHVPVDIISAPATNICIGMAIDSMVHLMFAVRRAQRDGKKGWDTWVAAREEQWRGIVFSDVIIAAGFGIFVLSDFPPTQRFGLVVLAGTIIDILANLFVLPLLGGAQLSKRPSAA